MTRPQDMSQVRMDQYNKSTKSYDFIMILSKANVYVYVSLKEDSVFQNILNRELSHQR